MLQQISATYRVSAEIKANFLCKYETEAVSSDSAFLSIEMIDQFSDIFGQYRKNYFPHSTIFFANHIYIYILIAGDSNNLDQHVTILTNLASLYVSLSMQ